MLLIVKKHHKHKSATKLKLNIILPIIVVIAVAIAGIFLLTTSGFGLNLGAQGVMSGFVTAIEDNNFNKSFDFLASNIQKTGSRDTFATKIHEKFGNKTIKIDDIATGKSTGYALIFVDNSTTPINVPLIKENGTWKINYFTEEAKCQDKCSSSVCNGDKTLVECKDTNGDGCKEEVTTTCEVYCSGDKCTTIKDTYTLKEGDMTATAPAIRLVDADEKDKMAVLEIGLEVVALSPGDTADVDNLKVTLEKITGNTVTLKVKVD